MSDTEEITDLSNRLVAKKYKSAAKIATVVLQSVIEQCVPGADIATICDNGDKMIETEVAKVFKMKVDGKK
jgi:methionine aminopeptidase